MLKTNLNKMILCATAKKLVAGIWHGDQLQQNEVFNHDELGKETFSAWVNHYAEVPIYLMPTLWKKIIDLKAYRIARAGKSVNSSNVNSTNFIVA